ncbi:MAG: helicase C-terminal domain-containing protein [Myxococcota bacterium]
MGLVTDRLTGGVDLIQRPTTRAAQGQQIHADWRAEQPDDQDAFRSEVRAIRTWTIGDWTVTLHGRVDGLRLEDGRRVVEEVKSTAWTANRLLYAGLDAFPDHRAQVEAYLWLLEPDHPGITGRLILVSVVDGSRHVLGIDTDPEEVGTRIQAVVARLVAVRARRLAWLDARTSHAVPDPFDAWRPGQREIVEAVHWGLDEGLSVLVQAPTGLGKTAAALTGALRHALPQRKQIVWLTARTTQQRAIVEACHRLQARGLRLRSVVIAAKAKACLNDVIVCRGERCAHAADYRARSHDDGVVAGLIERNAPLTADDVEAAGRAHMLCPYELTVDAAGEVDVVVGDYNYLFDLQAPLSRHVAQAGPGGIVVVIDEVHQLAERVRTASSPHLTLHDVRLAIDALSARGEAFAPFVDCAKAIEEAVLQEIAGASGTGTERTTTLDPHRWEALGDRIDGLALEYALLNPTLEDADEDAWAVLARSVLRMADALTAPDPAPDGPAWRVAIVHTEGRAMGIGLVCLDPSPLLGPRIASLGGFVGVSATLQPLAMHKAQLGLDPDRVDYVEVGDPFPPERRRVYIAPRISTAWADRAKHAPATARLLEDAIRAVPGNVAIYTPSFAMLDDLRGRMARQGRRWVVQTPRMSDAVRTEALDALSSPGEPVVLGAVLGGIFAEGIDLPPGALSAVFVCGPALPPIGLERTLLQHYWDAVDGAQSGQGFLFASLAPGLTRVVQAAGRLIRRPEDRGVVLLIGRRFRHRAYRALLPDAFQASVSDDPVADVAAFFELASRSDLPR